MKSLIMGCLGFILCCQTATAQQQFSPADFNQLCTFMTGSFSSELQSKRDTNYFDIRLQMAHIWPERTDGYWIYVEQAMVTALDKPYRQRIYRVNIKDAQTAESRVYTMKEPLRFAGAWNNKLLLSGLTPDSLESREGCSIFLKKMDNGAFEGSTFEKGCPSNLRGAAYATSEVQISVDKLISWDRGFDSSDKQVWGAEGGGYIFIKQTGE